MTSTVAIPARMGATASDRFSLANADGHAGSMETTSSVSRRGRRQKREFRDKVLSGGQEQGSDQGIACFSRKVTRSARDDPAKSRNFAVLILASGREW